LSEVTVVYLFVCLFLNLKFPLFTTYLFRFRVWNSQN